METYELPEELKQTIASMPPEELEKCRDNFAASATNTDQPAWGQAYDVAVVAYIDSMEG